jgi:hypothetical protein
MFFLIEREREREREFPTCVTRKRKIDDLRVIFHFLFRCWLELHREKEELPSSLLGLISDRGNNKEKMSVPLAGFCTKLRRRKKSCRELL